MVYRKRPLFVEAIKLEDTEKSLREVIEFMGGKVDTRCNVAAMKFSEYQYHIHSNGLKISTREGDMLAFPGDYIIKEPFATDDRKFYPCKPDIFKKTYEPAEPREPLIMFARKSGKVEILKAEVEAAAFGMAEEFGRYIQVKIGLDDEKTEWAKACLRECRGITNEALEKGLIGCAVENLAANLPLEDGNFYFDDVKVWEDV